MYFLLDWQDIVGLALAAFLGAIIGLEREVHDKPAGLRTNMLICLGAAIFTTISRYLEVGDGFANARITAQVVTGVGFLGAGAIIRDRGGVHGLTTAAGIWLVAGIGVACGAKYYDLAIISAALVFVVLLGLSFVPKNIRYRQHGHTDNEIDDQKQAEQKED